MNKRKIGKRIRNRKWILLCIFMIGIFLPGAAVSAGGTSRALLITRGDYDSIENNLSPGPENDGQNFRRALELSCGKEMPVIVLEKAGAQTVEEVTRAIQEAFKDADPEDVNYFYYSGHGGEEGMWLGGWEFLTATDLAQAFSGIQGTNFLVIDCCYSGNLITTRNASTEKFTEKFLGEFETAIGKRKLRSALTKSSFHVLVASGVGQESVQAGIGQYGEEMGFFTSLAAAGCGIDFTKVSDQEEYTCAAMADCDRDGRITFGELYQYVSKTLYASDAGIYPKQDEAVFLTVPEEQIPDTVITDTQIGYDEQGNVYLEAAYQSGSAGEFQAALYRFETEEEQWNTVIMSVEQDVAAYPYAWLIQTGAWRFEAGGGCARAELPLGTDRMEAGEYFLMVNKKGGNTGSYLFPLTLETAAEPGLMENMKIQAEETFSLEEQGTLDIKADFGEGPYSNLYDIQAIGLILDQSGNQVCSLGSRDILTEYTDGKYTRSCVFQWDGKKKNGRQVVSGVYTIEVFVVSRGRRWRKQKSVQVKSQAESDRDSIEGLEVRLSGTQFVYDGLPKEPAVRINGLQKGLDYNVSYENNRNAGQGFVRIEGVGNYCGEIVRNFTILPLPVSQTEIRVQKKITYTGKPERAKVDILYGNALREGTDYHLVYSNNRKPGYGKVKIQGVGNYTGAISRRFKILPAVPKTKKAVKTGEDTWKLFWKKSSAVSGYEIQYSTDKRFRKGIKKRNAAGAKKTRLTVKVPDGDRKYYFRIRSYKKINGKKWYSKFHVFS